MKSIALVTLAATTISLHAAAQPIATAVAEPVVELPPRYRIEFILFAHNRFDPAEEYFDVVPPTSAFAAEDEPIPQREFDDSSAVALQELIAGPIEAPEPEPEPELTAATPDLQFDAAGNPIDADGNPIDAAQPELEAFLDPALVNGPATRYLNLDELTLLPTLDRLERLDAYTPLLHSGWEQNGLAEADAVPLDLIEFNSTNPGGTLRLHMSRYLHMAIDVAWQNVPLPDGESLRAPAFGNSPFLPPQRPAQFGFGQNSFDARDNAAPINEPERYYLFEQRRILRNELNYFDHPAFGLLLRITLAPEPDPEPTPAVDGPSA